MSVGESEGRVVRVHRDEAVIEAEARPGCGRCDETQGCATGTLGKLFCRSPRQFRVRNDVGARPGDRVVVAVAEGVLWRSALAAYGPPLLLLLAGAVSGAALAPEPGGRDLYAALGALLGLAGGAMTARLASAALSSRPEILPRILRRC
jgi:sigma-E factor negative regulatory protein RseC